MTFFTSMSWPNHVPAVAAIRGRLVLFILNGFKGYLDCQINLYNKGTFWLEFNVRGTNRTSRVEMIFFDTLCRLIKAKATF